MLLGKLRRGNVNVPDEPLAASAAATSATWAKGRPSKEALQHPMFHNAFLDKPESMTGYYSVPEGGAVEAAKAARKQAEEEAAAAAASVSALVPTDEDMLKLMEEDTDDANGRAA